jgi:hypothetical protein
VGAGGRLQPRGEGGRVRVRDRLHVVARRQGRARGRHVRAGETGLVNVTTALAALGATPADVVRTRIYVTDISRWEEVGLAHGEVFGTVLPATSMVEVTGLIDPKMMVEIEAQAWVG